MGDVVTMWANKPHRVSIVICLKCYKRWVSVRPIETTLEMLECPDCGLVGYVIETGETFEPKGE